MHAELNNAARYVREFEDDSTRPAKPGLINRASSAVPVTFVVCLYVSGGPFIDHVITL
jgi:hypothetical protein